MKVLELSLFIVITDVDECAREQTCSEGSKCRNTEGSFACECMSGYVSSGNHCQRKLSCQVLVEKHSQSQFVMAP